MPVGAKFRTLRKALILLNQPRLGEGRNKNLLQGGSAEFRFLSGQLEADIPVKKAKQRGGGRG
jgi:hypothetical protein